MALAELDDDGSCEARVSPPDTVSAVVQERCSSEAHEDSLHCTTLTTAGGLVPQGTILQVHVRSCWSIVTQDRHMLLPPLTAVVELFRASDQEYWVPSCNCNNDKKTIPCRRRWAVRV